MQALTTIAARLIYGIPFIVFGVIHFLNARSMAGMVPSWIPGALFWVIVTGIALILGGVAISIKKVGRLASLLLALMLVIFILTIHIPGLMSSDMALPALLKDLALAGGALTYAGILSKEEAAA